MTNAFSEWIYVYIIVPFVFLGILTICMKVIFSLIGL